MPSPVFLICISPSKTSIVRSPKHIAQGIYGTEKALDNLGPFSFATETDIPGLFQCGASTMAPGINGVTHSGISAAATALGCNADELLTATQPQLRIDPARIGRRGRRSW